MAEDTLYMIRCLKNTCNYGWETNDPELLCNKQCLRCGGLNIEVTEVNKRDDN